MKIIPKIPEFNFKLLFAILFLVCYVAYQKYYNEHFEFQKDFLVIITGVYILWTATREAIKNRKNTEV